jgi:hypothetical protein
MPDRVFLTKGQGFTRVYTAHYKKRFSGPPAAAATHKLFQSRTPVRR